MIQRKSLYWFLGLAFIPAWILFSLPALLGAKGNIAQQLTTAGLWALAMWAPGLAAILVTRYVEHKPIRSLGLRQLGPRRVYLWAWLLPPALSILTGLLTWLLRAGTFDPAFPVIRDAMANAPGAENVPAWLVVVAQSAIALTLAPLFNMLFALGEELGWRGFLLPHLLPLGQWKAILIGGLIWGVWHAPAILQGLNYPNHPYLGILLMIVFTTLLGAIFSWLYLRTNSPWAPALAHGSLNASAGLPILFLAVPDITLGGTLASLIGWIPLGLFVGWLAWTRRLPVQVEPVMEVLS